MNPITHNSYRSLPTRMYSADVPVSVDDPRYVLLNTGLLSDYGLDESWFRGPEGLAILSGNAVNPDNPPLAMAYAGHQFGHPVPLLGDGRAHMLGQLRTTRGDRDVQLKGSGPTAFARGGDGRATLASVLREYVVSEALAGLGIPTTRSLAAIDTGSVVQREEPERGGILVRTARSHIRVGSFQHAAHNLGRDAAAALAEFTLERYFPELADADEPCAELLGVVVERQAGLIAQWMLVGFIHGVMNTDNMSIVGETIDFGPCAFMDEFHVEKAFSSIDRHGRYAWGNQANIGLWNLTRFAHTLLPLLDDDEEAARAEAQRRLEGYMPAFRSAFYGGLCAKLGLGGAAAMPSPAAESSESPGSPESPDAAGRFADRTLELLDRHALDMTVFFDTLTRLAEGKTEAGELLALFENEGTAAADAGREWLQDWRKKRSEADEVVAAMRAANPAVIARNHRVEEALAAATERDDFAPLHRLLDALKEPFACASEHAELQRPPEPEERVTATFCGT